MPPKVLATDHRGDGPDVSHHPHVFQEQRADDRDVRSAEPVDPQDELRTFLGYDIRAVVSNRARQSSRRSNATTPTKAESIESLVDQRPEADKELAPRRALANREGPIDLTNLEDVADSAPVRKLLNMVLLMAIKDHASDMHFEPFEDEVRIRIKADGVLYEMVPPPRHLAFAITTRIKVMANLDIAERRMPQDGRIELTVGGTPGRPARQRAADAVRRERSSCGCSTARSCRST